MASELREAAAAKLNREGAAIQWFMDAFGHCKTIARDAASQPLLDMAGKGVVALNDFINVDTRRHWDREPTVRDLA